MRWMMRSHSETRGDGELHDDQLAVSALGAYCGKAGNIPNRTGETAARLGAADRAAAVVGLALDAAGKWPLAEAALYGNGAAAACQY